MHRIWSDQPARAAPDLLAPALSASEPAPEPPSPAISKPVPAPAPPAARADSRMQPEELAPSAPAAAAASPIRPPLTSPVEPRSKKGLIAAAVLVIAAVGGTAGWFLLRAPGGGAEATPALVGTSAAKVPPAPSVAPPTTTGVPTGTESLELQPAQPETAAGAVPPAELVDQEVRRRLELERQRLEQTRRQQEAAAKAAPVLGRTPPQETREAPPPPAPAVEAPAQVSAPTTSAAPAPAEAAPAEAAPEPQTARRGDYVAPGTPGLVDPQLISLKKVSYPPAARTRKIEGIVILQVLVSETGSVVEAKVLRGVKPDVGIDDAALQAVRGASFKPGTKDGVAIRTTKTVTVPFKL